MSHLLSHVWLNTTLDGENRHHYTLCFRFHMRTPNFGVRGGLETGLVVGDEGFEEGCFCGDGGRSILPCEPA